LANTPKNFIEKTTLFFWRRDFFLTKIYYWKNTLCLNILDFILRFADRPPRITDHLYSCWPLPHTINCHLWLLESTVVPFLKIARLYGLGLRFTTILVVCMENLCVCFWQTYWWLLDLYILSFLLYGYEKYTTQMYFIHSQLAF